MIVFSSENRTAGSLKILPKCLSVVARDLGKGEGKGSECLLHGSGFPSGVMKMFWN